MTINFGTDGWRGVIGVDFTQQRLIRVCLALAEYVRDKAQSPGRVIVGYDTRFMSAEFALIAAEILAEYGHEVWLTTKAVATPVLSFAVKHWQAAVGLMVTASHNPPKYNGIKFKGSYGGSLLPDEVNEIAQYLNGKPLGKNTGQLPKQQITMINPDEQYLAKLATLVKPTRLASGNLKVVVDAMHGSSRGYLEHFLRPLGLTTVGCRQQLNPLFGGVNPEPIEVNLEPLRQAVLTSGADIGVAADGDGDRIGAMDEQGRYVSAQQLFPLLLEHLVKNRGWRGKVCKTFSTTSRVDLVAAKYQLPVITTPIGFKYICPYFLASELLMGGEESGGFGFQNHLPERDGILSALFLLELLVHSGKSLSTLLAEQDREFGTQVYQRIDLALKPTNSTFIQTKLKTPHIKTANQDSLEFTDQDSLESIDQAAGLAEHLGMPIATVSHLDGTKFTMMDGSWLLLRPSGTEPVLRLYAEASSQNQVAKMLEWASKVAGC